MLNLNPQLRVNSISQNQTAMQGKRRESQQKPIENVLFDNPVQKAKNAAVTAGKVGFLVGTVSTYFTVDNAIKKAAEQNNMFSEVTQQVSEKAAEVVTEKAAKPLQEKSKGLVKKVMDVKAGDVKKAVETFLVSPKVQKVADKIGHVAASLLGGVNQSVKLALTVGTLVLGLGALVKFADNQAMINDRLKSRTKR